MNHFKSLFALLLLLTFFLACKKSSSVDNNNPAINNPVPAIASISPASVTAGDPSFTITVTGTNFITGSTIRWNGTVLTTMYVSPIKLTAFISETLVASAGVSDITVLNPTPGGGISNTVAFTAGSISGNPVPSTTTLSPSSVTAGAATFTLIVNGTNFINNSIINWNGTALATTFISSLQLSATVSSGLVTTANTANVTVTTPAPGGGTSGALLFTISAPGNNPVPGVMSISPNSATAGASAFILTVNGSNFINSSSIRWNGTTLTTNYISPAILTATVNASFLATAGTATVAVFNPAPGGGISNSLSFSINNSGGGSIKKFLFDATKAETAGNADWVIDEDASPQRIPTPAQSTVTSSSTEGYWTGALSSWGIALAKLGQIVETLPSGSSISFGNSSNPQDLSNYDVFVIDEPNIRFTTAEKQAIINFVNNGGGLFMVSDHTQSDRNFDGWDSPDIWNDLMTNNGLVNNPFGFSVDLTNISGTSSNILSGNPANTILHGSQGNVSQIDFSNGATLTLNSSSNPNVQGLIWQSGYTQSSTHVMSASSTYGTGRIYIITDSSPLDDGTGASGNILYTSWPLYSHSQLFMNASLWLAKLQ